jgi:hypothetical protein
MTGFSSWKTTELCSATAVKPTRIATDRMPASPPLFFCQLHRLLSFLLSVKMRIAKRCSRRSGSSDGSVCRQDRPGDPKVRRKVRSAGAPFLSEGTVCAVARRWGGDRFRGNAAGRSASQAKHRGFSQASRNRFGTREK